MCSGSLRRFGAESKEMSGGAANASAAMEASPRTRALVFTAFMLLASRGRRMWMQQDFLHAPGSNFSGVQFVFAPAIELMNRAELARFLSRFSELTDHGPVQLQFVNVAGDGGNLRIVVVRV